MHALFSDIASRLPRGAGPQHGHLHGEYTPRCSKDIKPRPLSIADTLFAHGSNSSTNAHSERTPHHSLHTWLESAPRPLWEHQFFLLCTLYASEDCRAYVRQLCSQAVYTQWMDGYIERFETALFGVPSGDELEGAPAIPASDIVANECILLWKAYHINNRV